MSLGGAPVLPTRCCLLIPHPPTRRRTISGQTYSQSFSQAVGDIAASPLGSTTGYVGLGAGTGGSWADHRAYNFVYTLPPSQTPTPSQTPSQTQTPTGTASNTPTRSASITGSSSLTSSPSWVGAEGGGAVRVCVNCRAVGRFFAPARASPAAAIPAASLSWVAWRVRREATGG